MKAHAAVVPNVLGMDRYRAQVIFLQSLVSIVLSYQVLNTSEAILARPVQEVLVLGLLSLVAAAVLLPFRLVETRAFSIILLLIDTTVTSSIIYLTEQRGSDLYLAYFLIILISASMRTLWQKTALSALIAGSYAVILYASVGEDLFIEGHLIRISILLIMGVVYSVMSYNLEMERHDRMALVDEVNERVRVEEKLKASEALLRTLYEISVQTTDWMSRLQHILQIGCSSLGMTNAMFVRVADQHFTIQTMVGEHASGHAGEKFGLPGSYCEWTMTSREPVTFDNPESSEWKPPSRDPLIDPQAYAGMAVAVEGEICGVICFWNVRPRDRAFAGYEKVFLKLCAQWIGHEIEREAAEKGIRAAKDQAEAANRAKSEFLATMSHEIRTPMNAIVGMADLLAETELSMTQKEYLGVLSRSTTHLIELIDDILDLSKVESGRVQLEHVPFDLNEVLDKCAEALASRAHAKRLELIVSVAPDVACDLIGDPRALRQITWNLLSNAIKFTERGQVRLRVTNDHAGSRPGTLHFAVSDTGIGIPADKHALIFERFTQADSSTTRIYGGTGLGLAIAKHLVELAGGRIGVKSSVGIGTDFYFTMPFEVRKEYGGRIDLGGARVHVMIQHAQSREAVSEFLTARNATVTASPEVKATEAMLGRAVLDGVPYQFLIVDVTSLDLERAPDHLDLMTTARDCGTAVLLIVEDVTSSAIATFYRLGLGAYVPKPLTNNKLEQTFLKHAEKVTRHTALSSLTQVPGLSILVAEDSPDNQRLLEAYLKGTNHRMDIAENGRVAYEMYKAKTYDLVLMDVQMPVMDGLTATRMIREWERHEQRKSVPILALTAHAYEEQARASLAAGCSAHMTKPVRKVALLSEIEKWLLQKRADGGGGFGAMKIEDKGDPNAESEEYARR